MSRLAVFLRNWYIHAILSLAFIANIYKPAQAFPLLYRFECGGMSGRENVLFDRSFNKRYEATRLIYVAMNTR